MNDERRSMKFSPTQFIHNRMRHVDRRFVNSDPFVFFLVNYADVKAILSAVTFNLKKNTKWARPDSNIYEAILQKDPSLDEAFGSFFPSIRGHEDYFRVRRDEVQAMMTYASIIFVMKYLALLLQILRAAHLVYNLQSRRVEMAGTV